MIKDDLTKLPAINIDHKLNTFKVFFTEKNYEVATNHPIQNEIKVHTHLIRNK